MGRENRYPELALTARLIATSGYLAVIASACGGAVYAYNGAIRSDLPAVLAGVGLGVGGVLYGVFVLAASQVIRLLIDIERNTRPPEPKGPNVDAAIERVLRDED